MNIDIDDNSATPPYEQLRSQLARQVSERTLPVGTRLPTVRKLAGELGLAPNTVARAYRELEEAGLIETRGRAGSFVGAAGDLSRVRVQNSAAEYAELARRLGIGRTEAVEIVTAAIEHG